jgi:hypothetical protein
MTSKIVDICLSTLKREDVKKDIKSIFSPIIDLVLTDIYPYIYLSLIFVFISFVLHLGIFILLFRNKTVFSSKIN